MGELEYQNDFTEYIEFVEEPPLLEVDYTPVINDCTSSIISILLFSVFAIMGFFSAIQMLGRMRT